VSGERPVDKTTRPLFSRTAPASGSARAITLADLSEQIGALSSQLVQQGLHIDGVREDVNDRLGVFHQELSLLRVQVTGDIAPRVTAVEVDHRDLAPRVAAVEAKTGLQKAAIGGKYALYVTFGAMAARALAKLVPSLAWLDGALTSVGL
jgi:hypothetical protein